VKSGTDPTPIAHRLVRISTKWRIVRAHTYDDSGGKIYGATTDANGVFTVSMPPGRELPGHLVGPDAQHLRDDLPE